MIAVCESYGDPLTNEATPSLTEVRKDKGRLEGGDNQSIGPYTGGGIT